MALSFYKWIKIPRTLKFERRELEYKIQEMYQHLLPSGISYEKDKVDCSPEDKMSEGFSLILEEQDRSRKMQWEMYSRLVEITTACNKYLPDDREWFIVVQYYAKCQSARSLARCLNITERQFYRIKRVALDKLYKKWSEIYAEIVDHNSLL